ncbi:MAG: hypothetical protein JO071_02575 [Deltaproteobacteria bacterium]|nr:hypothetical protein [Deltaproteobacteria bacterium]
MRTIRTRIWLLRVLTLMALYLGTSAWAQSSGSSAPGLPADEPQVAQPSNGGVNWKGVGIGAGAVVCNLAYVPAKLIYGILGGIAGGAGYALTGGNKQVADSIWRSSLGGDYVLTPEMMSGKKPIYFSGPSEAAPAQASSGNSSSASNGMPSTPGAPLSAPAAPPGTGPTTYPIDNGAGPVGATGNSRPAPYAGGNNPSNGYRGYNRPPAPNGSSLSDTSIE